MRMIAPIAREPRHGDYADRLPVGGRDPAPTPPARDVGGPPRAFFQRGGKQAVNLTRSANI